MYWHGAIIIVFIITSGTQKIKHCIQWHKFNKLHARLIKLEQQRYKIVQEMDRVDALARKAADHALAIEHMETVQKLNSTALTAQKRLLIDLRDV